MARDKAKQALWAKNKRKKIKDLKFNEGNKENVHLSDEITETKRAKTRERVLKCRAKKKALQVNAV